MPIAAIVLFFVGLVLYKLVFEREAASAKYSEMTVLLTFGVALCVDGLLGTLFSNTQRVTTPRLRDRRLDLVGDVFIPKGQLYAGIASLVVIGALFLFLRYTPLRLRDPRHHAEPRRRAAHGRQCRLRLADHLRHRRRRSPAPPARW